MRIGEEYPVLEVFAARSRILFRLPDRSARRNEIDSPGLWDADMFEVVSDRMPTCWVTGLEDGRLTLAPREWQRPGFWEDYFDHVPGAVSPALVNELPVVADDLFGIDRDVSLSGVEIEMAEELRGDVDRQAAVDRRTGSQTHRRTAGSPTGRSRGSTSPR
ncbi:hypothetical protein ACFC1T_36255 [Kitasatospora sp. NPDC056076]|uniref:hypothetical protein n=1 Tax=Kitasatospora sp. NPDC056076 TaxID=3345703 RepID=UPI0035DF3382